MENQNFAQQLITARKAAGLTQEQLGERMHMSRQGISHWETGRALPDAETLKQLSQVLNYNFVTSEALQPESEPAAVPVQLAKRQAPLWKQPVAWLSLAVVVLATALVLVLLRDGAQPASQLVGTTAAPALVNTAERAEVRIIPAQNPLVPSYDPVLGPAPWWIFHLTLQETAGVEFTIEKMTYTYQYRNGERNVAEYGAEFVAAGNSLGTNVLRPGINLNFSGAEPLRDFAFIAVRVDGTDALGNELSFECQMDCVMPEPTETPAIDPQARAEMAVIAQTETAMPTVLEDLGPDPVWFVTFDIVEQAGVPIRLQQVTITTEGVHGWQDTFSAQQIMEIFGTDQISGHSALPWTFCNNLCEITGVTLRVEAVDANGNVLTAEDSVSLLRE